MTAPTGSRRSGPVDPPGAGASEPSRANGASSAAGSPPPGPSGAPRPPRLAERLLRACLPAGTVGASIVGDAREEYGDHVRAGRPFPRLWYWLHALSIARSYAGGVLLDTFVREVGRAVRTLAKQPGPAIVSVLVLALGIGLSTFMFSLVYGVFLRGLGVPEADRIAVLEQVDTRRADSDVPPTSHDFLDFRERLSSFEALAGYYGGTVNLSGEATPERFQGAWVTANTFDVLRVRAVLGRTFAAGEDGPGEPPRVLLAHAVWRDRYGSDPDVVGRAVRVNGEQGTVVGVMPEGFRWPSRHDVWITMSDDPLAVPRGEGRRYSVIGRLADGVSWEEASREVERVAAELEREHPELNEGLSAHLITVSQQQSGGEIGVVFMAMMVAVLCVLLVACANVANLLLARAVTRTREAGVRVALGAGRVRVMMPFLAEALVLACAGAALGTALAYQAVELFDRATATPITGRPYFIVFEVDLPALGWVVGTTALTALVAGVAPAFQVSRADVSGILKDESRGSSGLHQGRLSKGLVMVEVALSVALLVGAGLMTRSMVQLARYEMPFEPGAYLSGRMSLFEADYPERDDRQALWREVERRIRAVPGVASAALTSVVPGTGAPTMPIGLPGEDGPGRELTEWPRAHFQIVSPGYFETMGMPVLQGGVFRKEHTREVDRVAVVNESFARRFWPDGPAVGRSFRTGSEDTDPRFTVIGLVPDFEMRGFGPTSYDRPDGFYVPVAQADASVLTIVARAVAGAPETLAPGLREAVRGVDPDLPLYELQSVQSLIDEGVWIFVVFGSVFVVFGLAALFMASAGLYGVLSFSVSRRLREMGIRMALGAGAGRVVRLVVRQAATQIAVGMAAGLVLAAGVSRVVEVLLFQVSARDPMVFGGVVALIVVVGLAASLVPARRATRVDPMEALRAE